MRYMIYRCWDDWPEYLGSTDDFEEVARLEALDLDWMEFVPCNPIDYTRLAKLITEDTHSWLTAISEMFYNFAQGNLVIHDKYVYGCRQKTGVQEMLRELYQETLRELYLK